MNKEQKGTLIKILISAALFLAAFLIPSAGTIKTALFIAAYLAAGYEVLYGEILDLVQNASKKKTKSENFSTRLLLKQLSYYLARLGLLTSGSQSLRTWA